MDYAAGKHSDQIISDAKYVFPLIVMFLPLPFFWALFDMKGDGSTNQLQESGITCFWVSVLRAIPSS